MNDTRRKMLTEYLGSCRHEITDKGPYQSMCSKCGMTFGAIHSSDWNPTGFNRTFTTAQDMVDLGKRMMVNGDWNPFYCDTFNDWYARNRESVKNTEDADAKFVAWLLFTNPARTCELIAEWMEGKHESTK
jgi:hypothetical protein